MHLIKLTNGVASCHVMLPGVFNGKLMDGIAGNEAAVRHAIECEYYSCEDITDIACFRLRGNDPLEITYDCGKISHTAYEWCSIYDGVIREPVILSQSEY